MQMLPIWEVSELLHGYACKFSVIQKMILTTSGKLLIIINIKVRRQ